MMNRSSNVVSYAPAYIGSALDVPLLPNRTSIVVCEQPSPERRRAVLKIAVYECLTSPPSNLKTARTNRVITDGALQPFIHTFNQELPDTLPTSNTIFSFNSSQHTPPSTRSHKTKTKTKLKHLQNADTPSYRTRLFQSKALL
jgi:hypothetical protein